MPSAGGLRHVWSSYLWYQFASATNSLKVVTGILGYYNTNDQMIFDGYAASSSACSAYSSSGQWECFYIDDVTQNWYISNLTFQRPSGTIFDGPTFEQIRREMPKDPTYQFWEFRLRHDVGLAWDQTLTEHTDFTDPWIFQSLWNGTTGHTLATPFLSKRTILRRLHNLSHPTVSRDPVGSIINIKSPPWGTYRE